MTVARGVVTVLGLVACNSRDDTRIHDAQQLVDVAPDAPSTSFNGCTLLQAIDARAIGSSRVIAMNDDNAYDPPCLRIAAGQRVSWSGALDVHPLAAGIVRLAMIESQPGSPIVATSSGQSTETVFATAGAWGFYCPNHLPGMIGVVYVDL